jgi:hypothetical protein
LLELRKGRGKQIKRSTFPRKCKKKAEEKKILREKKAESLSNPHNCKQSNIGLGISSIPDWIQLSASSYVLFT